MGRTWVDGEWVEWVEDEEMTREVERLERESRNEKPISLAEFIRKYGEPTDIAYLEKEHFTKPKPIKCKFCGSTDVMKYGIRNGEQNYICKKCGRKFIAKDAPMGMRTPTEQIGASLNMYYDGLSVVNQRNGTLFEPNTLT